MNTSHPYSPQKAAYDKNWRQNHKPERRLYKEKWTKHWRNTLKGKYAILQARAKHRKLALELSFEQYAALTPLLCYYCGGDRSATWGLDRINNDLGYLLKNVRPCCRKCNIAKNDMTEAEFKQWMTALAKHWL